MNDSEITLDQIRLDFQRQFIFLNYEWISSLYQSYIVDQEYRKDKFLLFLKQQIIDLNISVFIDYQQIKSINEINNFDIKVNMIKGYYFLQILQIGNISEPKKLYSSNIDVVEKIDNKYLRSEEENKVQEKQSSLNKMLLTDGRDEILAFEYEKIPFINISMMTKQQKVLIGPEVEIRRGIMYLTQKNIKLYN